MGNKIIGLAFFSFLLVGCASTQAPTIGINNPNADEIERESYVEKVMQEGDFEEKEAIRAQESDRRLRANYKSTTDNFRRGNRG